MTTVILIDLPTPFSARSEWADFLDEMRDLKRLHPRSEEVAEAIRRAEAALKA
jgi:hypothetical protein